jgi:hypothetical protein
MLTEVVISKEELIRLLDPQQLPGSPHKRIENLLPVFFAVNGPVRIFVGEAIDKTLTLPLRDERGESD